MFLKVARSFTSDNTKIEGASRVFSRAIVANYYLSQDNEYVMIEFIHRGQEENTSVRYCATLKVNNSKDWSYIKLVNLADQLKSLQSIYDYINCNYECTLVFVNRYVYSNDFNKFMQKEYRTWYDSSIISIEDGPYGATKINCPAPLVSLQMLIDLFSSDDPVIINDIQAQYTPLANINTAVLNYKD